MNRVFNRTGSFSKATFSKRPQSNITLGNCNSVSDEDRSILEQVGLKNQKFEFFRFDGLFEDGVNGNGIVVYDPFAGKEISSIPKRRTTAPVTPTGVLEPAYP